ncbi:helix-turn-helix transcriptional regulator [Thermomicrobium sp.]|uniref:helix-turn-helix domain-containing protein n=1 Tax=Thermomicrobium sp. TaxID=1969469 RepID=UPI001B227D06|nr:helix-turn-helix transcriptional regulator [Thermomicrobium sp.]MBO9308002.1 helix-turn-helix transcriptional regulator [Thermomicrobium sp.]
MTHPANNSYAVPAGPFGSLLKQLRESRGLSQSKLGRRCGISHATVSRLESGSRAPSRSMVSRLARAMSLDDVEFAQLLAAAGFWPTVAANERQFLLATLSRKLEDRTLDEETREQAVEKVSEIVSWLNGQLGKEQSV